MGTSLAGEGEKNCVRPISTSLEEGRKWLNFFFLHKIGVKEEPVCFAFLLSKNGRRC